MRKGTLSKSELRTILRNYRDLTKLIDKLPDDPAQQNEEEKCTLELLIDARRPLADIMRWQDYRGVWQEATVPASAQAAV